MQDLELIEKQEAVPGSPQQASYSEMPSPDELAELNSLNMSAPTPEEIQELSGGAQTGNVDSPSPDELAELTGSEPEGKYDSLGQQALTAIEGAAQGFAGPLATAAEKGLSALGVPGLADEDIRGRQEANPWTHGIAQTVGVGTSFATPMGIGSQAMKAAEAATKLAGLGRVGSSIVGGMISSGLLQVGNEASKWMIDDSNPEEAVGAHLANVGAAALLGGGLGGLGAIGKKGAEAINKATEGKLASYGKSWLAGFAHQGEKLADDAIDHLTMAPDFNRAMWDAGRKAYDSGVEKAVNKAIQVSSEAIGLGTAGPVGYYGSKVFEPIARKVLSRPLTTTAQATAPIAKWLSTGAAGDKLWPIIQHYNQVQAGNRIIDKAIDGLFRAGAGATLPAMSAFQNTIRDRDKLDKKISDGGLMPDIQDEILKSNQQQPTMFGNYAEGGQVQAAPELALDSPNANDVFPDQNVLMTMAKGRISNYLTSLKPQSLAPKLAFDDEPDLSEQTRTYHQALDIANNPMQIMHEIKNGTIEPEQIKHFNNLYPEINGILQKKLTDKISQAQMDGNKPSYHVRQGLSLLLGTPLSGELTPQNIQAAQAVFQQGGQQGAQGAGGGGGMSKSSSHLSKAGMLLRTPLQARGQELQHVDT